VVVPGALAFVETPTWTPPEPYTLLPSTYSSSTLPTAPPWTIETEWTTTLGSETAAQNTVNGVTRWRQAVGGLPKLRTLGTIGLLAGGFDLGWHIGGGLDDWLHISCSVGDTCGTSATSATITAVHYHFNTSYSFSLLGGGTASLGPGWILEYHSTCGDDGAQSSFLLSGSVSGGVGCSSASKMAAKTALADSMVGGTLYYRPTNTCASGWGNSSTSPDCVVYVVTEAEMESNVNYDEWQDYSDFGSPSADATTSFTPSTIDFTLGTAILEDNEDAQNFVNTQLDPRVLAPRRDENYLTYLGRLQAVGLVGDAHELSEELIDPDVGPEAVSRVTPEAGTSVEVGSEVEVYYNPASAPPASDGTIGPGDCDCPPPDFTPLTDADYGDNFPFGIFVWIVDTVEVFDVGTETPVIEWPIPTLSVPGIGTIWTASEVEFDFGGPEGVVDDWMGWWRTIVSWVLWVGAIWYVGSKFLNLNYTNDPSEALDDAPGSILP